AAAAKLETLSPLKTLGRGYAICQDEKGAIIRSAKEVPLGGDVIVQLHVGRLFCQVKKREAEDG
ncbi:MAG TPA: exodeoxyribonuclease VII large subunit, partial [Firmicutes bacterium]|nr:exodeoxyribonuclease VII large subunit [Bacillota bacterium]